MQSREYLINYGADSFLGRFTWAGPLSFQRGDQVIVQGHRGLELGTVLCEATAEHARLLTAYPAGSLVRPARDEDDRVGSATQEFEEASRLATELHVPVDIVDIEHIFDPRTIVVHYLRKGPGSLRPLVKGLAQRLESLVEMKDLSLGVATEYGDQDHDRYCNSNRKKGGGCGSGGCGSGNCGNGGCGDGGCGTGGCGNGGCGASQPVEAPVEEVFIELRHKFQLRTGQPN